MNNLNHSIQEEIIKIAQQVNEEVHFSLLSITEHTEFYQYKDFYKIFINDYLFDILMLKSMNKDLIKTTPSKLGNYFKQNAIQENCQLITDLWADGCKIKFNLPSLLMRCKAQKLDYSHTNLLSFLTKDINLESEHLDILVQIKVLKEHNTSKTTTIKIL